GRLDIVVNNAATNPAFGPTVEVEARAVRKILEVNLEGPLHLIQAAWRAWMRDHGGVRHVSSAMEVSKAWAGWRSVPLKLPRTMDALRADYDAGYRYYLIDHWGPLSELFWHQEGYYVEGVSEIAWSVLSTAEEMERHLKPVAVIPNPIGGTIQPIFEMNFRVDLALDEIRQGILDKTDKIYIYDLEQLFGPGGDLHEPSAPAEAGAAAG
ncbi:MAG: SDR family oxidoreductase, partial [Myxococcales bacterium]|nr:SDR family oxidoreductase [Myxococcales bacterium]